MVEPSIVFDVLGSAAFRPSEGVDMHPLIGLAMLSQRIEATSCIATTGRPLSLSTSPMLGV
jgi:hypothetical protein